MKILGIETSCDETAAAVVDLDEYGQGRIVSNLVLSQLEAHQVFGGVVPEVAARAHIDHLHTLIKAAMNDAGLTFEQLDGVAATSGPGLLGGVMIGMMAGKSIACAHNKPFIAVNHLEGHALTPRLTDNVAFPYLLLLISGGHSQILVAEDVGKYTQIGTTLDDAAGECFDKAAKAMGLPYPGGPNLEKLAAECAAPDAALAQFPLPRPMKGRKNYDMSFSGLKTAVRVHIDNMPKGELNRTDMANLAYAFQTAMCEILTERCTRAIKIYLKDYKPQIPAFVVSGGVAANTAIRRALETLAQKHEMQLYAPPLRLCGDNAAMIAWAGLERLRQGMNSPLNFKARPRWPLTEL